MPIDFDYRDMMDINLNELDELQDFISEGDVETDRVFEEEEGEDSDLTKNFEKVIVVDNLPVGVPNAKLEKLSDRLRQIFSQTGKIEKDGLCVATNEDDGTTLGWAFIAYETEEGAKAALNSAKDGIPLDKRHLMKVLPYTKLQQYESWPDEYVKPVKPEYVPGEDLESWLVQPSVRDQYLLRHGDSTEIRWCESLSMNAASMIAYDGARERANGLVWCDMYTAFSPKGSYLVTFHDQGIQLWGGLEFKKLKRFAHPDVQQVDFSPDEKYLFTWNGRDDNKDLRSLIAWDLNTNREIRSFKVSKPTNGENTEWPVMRWCPNSKYFARQILNGISIFESDSFRLLGGKSIKVHGIKNFEWSKGDSVISYWAPEVDNLPARVVLFDPATKKELRSKNLFNVRDVKMHWQNNGDFLCAQVLRHSKTGRTTFTNLELFRMRDPNYPAEMIEIKDMVEAFAWEPSRDRFAIIHGESSHKQNVSIYSMDGIKAGKNVSLLYTIPNKQISGLHWSPAGNYILFTGSSMNGQIEFYDVDENIETSVQSHFMCNEVRWDPSGRMVATIVAQPMFGSVQVKYQLENGFKIWSFQGDLLVEEKLESFYQFLWRPRPKTLLDQKDISKINRGIKGYMARYEKEDQVRLKRIEAAENKEKIDALQQFRELVEKREAKVKEIEAERQKSGLSEPINDDDYEIIDEIEEVFVSEKVEPYQG